MERFECEIMTAQEVAGYLRLTEATIYKLAQAGDIPAIKVGRAWRFKKELIDEWIRYESTQRPTEQEPAGLENGTPSIADTTTHSATTPS